MSRFFISYRREDGSGYAGRIYDHLVSFYKVPSSIYRIDLPELS